MTGGSIFQKLIDKKKAREKAKKSKKKLAKKEN